MKIKVNKFFAILVSVFLTLTGAQAVTLKVGVLAPQGTSWANNLQALAQEVQKETAGAVKFKMYFGGVAGDEPVVLRKIHSGQMHGGVFTGKTLGMIHGDVRVIEIPFTFYHNRQKAWETLEKMRPLFDKGFAKKEFYNVGFFEIGPVYLISSQKMESFDNLKGQKIWHWDGDKLGAAMIEGMNLISVPLSLPDVLTSLSTGVIHSAYASPLAILAMQWQTKVKYLVDFPMTFAVGAFLLSQKSWQEIPAAHRAKVSEICKKYIDAANLATVKENEESLTAMKGAGLEFIKFAEKDITTGQEVRKKVIKKLQGDLFSKEAVDMLEKEAKGQNPFAAK